MDLYCPQCDAPRTEDQLDGFGNCVVCGANLSEAGTAEAIPETAEETAETPAERAQETTPETVPDEPADAADTEDTDETIFPDAATHRPAVSETPEPSDPSEPSETPETSETPEPLARTHEPRAASEPVPRSVDEPPPRDELPSEDPTLEAAETTPYAALVGDVERHLENGYELFGLVGHAGSGKTHCLKALTYLLQRHGVGSQKAGVEFRRAPVPGQTAAQVFDYAYTGPGDEKWVFVDAGGELYLRLRENDWTSYPESSTQLTGWLHRCHGLFCFLHLQPGHFRGQDLDVDPTHEDDSEAREALEARRRKARQDQEELELFRHFFLFLRALKAEDGRVERVIERCRSSTSLDEALRDYHFRTPRLDIPVMFFFTQADAYARRDFEIAPGIHINPRTLQAPPAALVARYLPSLFSALVSQVRHFKFDFLQSYEEHPTGRRDRNGEEIVETYWTDPQDEGTLLSAGLMSGLELVLRHRVSRHRTPERSRWRLPQISTRQALRLHKLLHPGDWKGVPPNLLSPARLERTARTAEREEGEP